jgi:hypothetical protein
MKHDYEKSSGNMFADLGFRRSKQELLKTKLTVEIYKHLKARGSRGRRRDAIDPEPISTVPGCSLTPARRNAVSRGIRGAYRLTRQLQF